MTIQLKLIFLISYDNTTSHLREALISNKRIGVELISSSNQMINVLISNKRIDKWLFTTVYASIVTCIRHKFWNDLKEISSRHHFPWLSAEDFNELSNNQEMRRGASVNTPGNSSINSFLEECCLIDLGATVVKHTWSDGRSGSYRFRECLDISFCCPAWCEAFPKTIV